MISKYNNSVVVRDPGTIFICWEQPIDIHNNKKWLLIASNISTGEKITQEVQPESGKHYLHSLQPDTYYSIIIAEHNSSKNKFYKLIDFGTIHTLKSQISESSDPDEKWRTDLESLQRLTGTDWIGISSCNGHYNV